MPSFQWRRKRQVDYNSDAWHTSSPIFNMNSDIDLHALKLTLLLILSLILYIHLLSIAFDALLELVLIKSYRIKAIKCL